MTLTDCYADHFDMEMHEPYKVLRGLSTKELIELREEMQVQAAGQVRTSKALSAHRSSSKALSVHRS